MKTDDFIYRIGHGYDVHRLKPGRRLVIGGVKLDYELGLEGHSDADVLVHAVMDAVLGAMGCGDIGCIFPDSDERFLNAESSALAGEVSALMTKRQYKIVNIDATIIAQAPRMSPYIRQMKINIAKTFGCPEEAVNIKATTEEGLGFTGEGKGIAAHAVVLLAGRSA